MALSVNTMVAWRWPALPAVAGAKDSLTVQLADGAIAVPIQFPEGAVNSVGLPPPSAIAEIFKGALPGFDTVTLNGALTDP